MFSAHVYLRFLASGRVVAIPVDFADLAVEAAEVEEAVRLLRSRIARALRRGGLSGLGVNEAPQPARVAVAVPGRGKGSTGIEITVGLVVLRRRSSRGEAIVVRAPAVPGFELFVGSGEDALATAAARLGKHLREWPLDSLLALDEVNEARLEVIELPLPPTSARPSSMGPPMFAYGHEDEEGDIFQQAGECLTEKALEKQGRRFDRRDELVERVLAALAGPERSSVLLVGPPDVGKTALVHELATRIAGGEVPPALIGRDVWRLSANELIAGAKYTGMWQDRVRRLIDRASEDSSIVVLGDPVGVVDAGRWSESSNNMSRFLRPYVESGELTLIVEATRSSLAAARKKEPSFIDAFHLIEVPEPAPAQAVEIGREQAHRLAAALDLRVDESAVEAALSLTRRFEPYRALPGKLVRLLEETAQRVLRLQEETVDREQVVATFSERTGLPLALLSDEQPMRLEGVRSFFEARVLGQPEAVEAMVDLASVLKAGLNDPNKPLGVFLFVGPTGVGKTELAKALAEFLFSDRERIVRFDMGEFASAEAVDRLVGTRWTAEGEGELTQRVRDQPFSIVLLDEIEKAHWRLFDLLLSAIGEGRLTDASGRTADFRSTIVIMTSNLGASRRQTHAVGFDSGTEEEAARLRNHYVEQAEGFFRPEFFNRIDRLIVFDPLGRETIRRIARRDVGKLLTREGILRRKLLIEVDDRAIDLLADRGFHPLYGARPLQREIERAVIQPLSRLIVDQQPRSDDIARVHVRDGVVGVDLQRVHVPESAEPVRAKRRSVQRAASLKKAVANVDELLRQVDRQRDAAVTGELRLEANELIEETHAPTFWDDGVKARETLARIYSIERVLDDLDAVARRADGLREMAVQMERKEDRSRLQELRQALDEIEESLLLNRLEVEAAAGPSEVSVAVIRVIPVGSDARQWADSVCSMYKAWAERTGREAKSMNGRGDALVISGPASYDLLRGEGGIHRRVRSESLEQARVLIEREDAPDSSKSDDSGSVVRIYDEGRRHGVRDPRTGVRVGNVTAVLEEGRIDDFLIGSLRAGRQSASTA